MSTSATTGQSTSQLLRHQAKQLETKVLALYKLAALIDDRDSVSKIEEEALWSLLCHLHV